MSEAITAQSSRNEPTEAESRPAACPAVLRPFLRRAIRDPEGLKRGIYQTMPRALFALLPAFAVTYAVVTLPAFVVMLYWVSIAA